MFYKQEDYIVRVSHIISVKAYTWRDLDGTEQRGEEHWAIIIRLKSAGAAPESDELTYASREERDRALEQIMGLMVGDDDD
jgi:hypothetical protein